MSRSGRNWQARRTAGSAPAPTRSSTKLSRFDGGGSAFGSPTTRMRQVEHRALPPHTLACGMPFLKLASRTLKPFGTLHLHAVRIRERDHAAAPLGERRDAARGEDQAQNGRVADREPEDDLVEQGALRRRRQVFRREIGRSPFGLLRERDDFAPALDHPEQRERRQQRRRDQQVGRGAREEALQPQPVIEPDAAVHPRDEQQRELHPFQVGAI